MTYVVMAVLLGALSSSIAVTASVLKQDPASCPKRFPWFWIAFPLLIFSVAALVALLMSGLTAGGWTMYTPLADADSVQFLSNDQFSQLGGNVRHNPIAWILSGCGVVAGAIGSVVAWRRSLI